MDFLSEWFNLSNALYLIILIIGLLATMVTAKYRAIVGELKELFEVVKAANEDGTVTEEEKERILKEVFDVLRAILAAVWRPFGKSEPLGAVMTDQDKLDFRYRWAALRCDLMGHRWGIGDVTETTVGVDFSSLDPFTVEEKVMAASYCSRCGKSLETDVHHKRLDNVVTDALGYWGGNRA